ncbi:MAG TPA: hypothetical protein VHA73_11720 [Acidimicrobiales bacterium]|nr:hypothetical protein [Acidimicrobiales bacterium]
MALGEVLVHGCDALRAVGHDIDTDPETVVPVLDIYQRIGRAAFGTAPARTTRLVATDTAWSAGSGPEVTGRAIDLALLLARRPQVLDALSGPGVPQLARR